MMTHHLCCDHRSLSILAEDIFEHLASGTFSEPAPNYPAIYRRAFPETSDKSATFWLDRTIVEPSTLLPQAVDLSGSKGAYIQAEVDLSNVAPLRGSTVASNAIAATAAAVTPFLEGSTIDLGLVSGRETNEADRTFGALINTLPISVHAPSDKSIHALAQNAQSELGEVIEHRRVPLLRIANLRRASGKFFAVPRFLVSVVDEKPLLWEGEVVGHQVLHAGGAVLPASFFVLSAPSGVKLGLEYNRRVISDATARQMHAIFCSAYQAAYDVDARTVAEIADDALCTSLLIAEESSPDTPIVQQILDAAASQSSSPALRFQGTEYSWQWLIERAQKLAAALDTSGVTSGDTIAIMLPRGPNFIAAILAALGRGVAYVPIDISYPDDRIAGTLSAAKPKLILREVGLGLLVTDAGIAGTAWANLPIAELIVPEGDTLAYVMYMSGSTGSPLGVPITHAQVSQSTNARRLAYPDSPGRFVLVSSFAFDSSVVGLYWTLATGGTLVIPDQAEMRDPRALAAMMERDADTTLMVPTLYDVVLDVSSSGDWPRHVILAGEACPQTVTTKHFARFPESSLTNEYGPTEVTVWSLYHPIDQSSVTSDLPIGRPVPGLWAAVVDESGASVPIGVTGELVIGGGQVANGYIGERTKTTNGSIDLVRLDCRMVLFFSQGIGRLLTAPRFIFTDGSITNSTSAVSACRHCRWKQN